MTTRTVSFAKEGHQYLFRYEVGLEDEILEAVMALAEDSRANLDWLDAATLSFQVAHEAASDISEIPTPFIDEHL